MALCRESLELEIDFFFLFNVLRVRSGWLLLAHSPAIIILKIKSVDPFNSFRKSFMLVLKFETQAVVSSAF